MNDADVDEHGILKVGHISAAFGIKGWVKVHSDTSPRENILGYRPWYLRRNNRWEQVEVAEGSPHGKGVVARLAGIEDRNAAELLAGLEIGIPEAALPRLGRNEYYWRDLIGLTVVTADGALLGVVDHLVETGANDVLVVKACPGSVDEAQRLLPWVKGQVIRSVDTDAKRIIVDWGLDW